jgi:ubiquitin-protein ligase
MSMVRLRRLHADHAKLREYVRQQPRVQLLRADGDPPEIYQLRYQVVGLRQKEDGLSRVDEHLVEITLPLNYPRLPPQCRMLTPAFHPNIAPHAICIGDHWNSGESLTSIVARIGELLSYQSYNTKSPLNGEAARWVDENLEDLPLDAVSFVPNDLPAVAAHALPSSKPLTGAQAIQEMPEVLPIDEADEPPAVLPVGPPNLDELPSVLPLDEPARSAGPAKFRRAPAEGDSRTTASPSWPAANKAVDAAAAEMVRVPCQHCGVALRFRATLLGKTVRCPACKGVSKLPEQPPQ